MSHDEQTPDKIQETVPDETIPQNAPPREWVAPTFERIGLKEAMGSISASDAIDLYGMAS